MQRLQAVTSGDTVSGVSGVSGERDYDTHETANGPIFATHGFDAPLGCDETHGFDDTPACDEAHACDEIHACDCRSYCGFGTAGLQLMVGIGVK